MKIDTNNLTVPPYLNEKFFQNALEDGLRECRISIKTIVFEMGSGAGDNYCSSIYRVRIEFNRPKKPDEKISIIVKSIPITPETQFLEDLEVFIKEKCFYVDILPRLEILLDEPIKFGAKYFYSITEPIQTIVFDDLNTYGYTTASRQNGLDEEHCVMILEKLGKFHAASMVLAKKDPSVLPRFTDGMLSERSINKSDTFKLMFGANLKMLAEISAKWPGYEKISEKLLKYYDNFNENVVECGIPDKNGINVMNHGDLWVNNFMFKYAKTNPGVPLDALFVDFQLNYYCSPGCDLNFFLNTSVQLDVLINKREYLVERYFTAFKNTLESLRYDKIPTLEDMKKEIRARERYGFFGLFGFLPVVSLEAKSSDGSSIESLVNDSGAAKKRVEIMFSSQRVIDTCKYAVKRFDDLGIFDE